MRKTCLAATFWLLFTSGTFVCFGQNKPVFSIPFTLVDNRPFIDVKIKQHTFILCWIAAPITVWKQKQPKY